jgi:MarR family transcriptional regulator, organic hydroperoxide resistance regulator
VPDLADRDAAIFETMQSLRRIFKAIQDYSREVSDKYGITGPQLWALKTISQDGSLPLGVLSKKMYLHPSTTSGVVDRLENKGYVTRERAIQDRRVVNVSLTLAGASLAKKTPNPVQGKMVHGLRCLGENELTTIYGSVQRLVEIMEAQDLKVTFFFDREEEGTLGDRRRHNE